MSRHRAAVEYEQKANGQRPVENAKAISILESYSGRSLGVIELQFEKSADGLVPAVAQDYKTGEVLMLAYISRDSWAATLESGYATYWSRSRQELWRKGDTSGNLQRVKDIFVDCDLDAVVFKVEQVGGKACHTGKRSCFFRKVAGDTLTAVD